VHWISTPGSMSCGPSHDVCDQLLQEVSFSGDPSGTTPNACQGQIGSASPCCTNHSQAHHWSPPSLSLWKTQCAQSIQIASLAGCPSMERHSIDQMWQLSCASLGAHSGKSGGCSLCSGNQGVPCVPAPGNRLVANAPPCLWFQPSFRDDGNAQGQRYCGARGEILRSLQDQQQQRRLASACSSIKNESVGSKDDQTPS